MTYWPLRGVKTPHATTFLDSGYFAGYPNSAGLPTQPALKGYRHTGTDMNGPGACNSDEGDALYTVRECQVEFASYAQNGTWGPVIVLEVFVEGRFWWVRYGHVNATSKKTGATVKVVKGQKLTARQVLGFVGRGSWPCAHLHIDVFHAKPPSWLWWPTRYGAAAEVTKYCTDPDAWLRRLQAVSP
ncbi:hypothetical protein V3W47_18970 [Deinococcus sp. YIM 134068]|uniref:hypothetical protein n=1 Tax=Deinococcus lichenicola TaxID=3118910 RepID=UPI002F95BB60